MKKNGYSKIIVASIVVLNVLFAAAVLYVFREVGKEPKTLIGCWFGSFTGELWLLANIKKKKIQKKDEGE